MPLVEYQPDLFEPLRCAAERFGVRNLAHAPFVNYYYTNNSWSRLKLWRADDGSVTGIIGIEQMPFVVGDRQLTLAFASNFHATRPGPGGYLYLHWMKTCSLGLVFGGSEFTHRILRQQRWRYFTGVKIYTLNQPCREWPGEPLWRRWAKQAISRFREIRLESVLGRMPSSIRATVSVSEVAEFAADMLPSSSPFAFRLAPTVDYLRWRYHPGLSFVRYRLFRVCSEGKNAGYVILNQSPERIIVAQCDGTGVETLGYGVLLSVAAAIQGESKLPEVLLATSYPALQWLYRDVGFRPEGEDRPFVLGSGSQRIDVPDDTASWHVNFDWGDNGLRAPFLDQRASACCLNAGLPAHKEKNAAVFAR